MPRAVRERGVDERFALLLLGGLRLADADLDAVDAPEGLGDAAKTAAGLSRLPGMKQTVGDLAARARAAAEVG